MISAKHLYRFNYLLFALIPLFSCGRTIIHSYNETFCSSQITEKKIYPGIWEERGKAPRGNYFVINLSKGFPAERARIYINDSLCFNKLIVPIKFFPYSIIDSTQVEEIFHGTRRYFPASVIYFYKENQPVTVRIQLSNECIQFITDNKFHIIYVNHLGEHKWEIIYEDRDFIDYLNI